MPVTLPAPSWLTATDDAGRILRCEELKAGADLDDRLRLAHRHYQLKGWSCDPLTRASSGFGAVMGSRRLVVAIRRIRPGALPESRRSALGR